MASGYRWNDRHGSKILRQDLRKTESGGQFTGPLSQPKSSRQLSKGQVLKQPESQSKVEKTHRQVFGIRVFANRVVYDWIQIKSTKVEGVISFWSKKKRNRDALKWTEVSGASDSTSRKSTKKVGSKHRLFLMEEKEQYRGEQRASENHRLGKRPQGAELDPSPAACPVLWAWKPHGVGQAGFQNCYGLRTGLCSPSPTPTT